MKMLVSIIALLVSIGTAAEIKNRYSFNSCEVFGSSEHKKYTGGEYIFTPGFQEVVEYRNGMIIRHRTWLVGHNVTFAKFDDCSYLDGSGGKIYFCGDDDLYIVYDDMSVHYFNTK